MQTSPQQGFQWSSCSISIWLNPYFSFFSHVEHFDCRKPHAVSQIPSSGSSDPFVARWELTGLPRLVTAPPCDFLVGKLKPPQDSRRNQLKSHQKSL
jgi:hypothetical protein